MYFPILYSLYIEKNLKKLLVFGVNQPMNYIFIKVGNFNLCLRLKPNYIVQMLWGFLPSFQGNWWCGTTVEERSTKEEDHKLTLYSLEWPWVDQFEEINWSSSVSLRRYAFISVWVWTFLTGDNGIRQEFFVLKAWI